MRPVLCFVTDRTRHDGVGELVAHVAAAARAGVHLVQVRERGIDARDLIALVTRCVDAVRGTRARILVNDRVDVALAGGAHGVHLRGDSLPAARVRTIAPSGWVIGRSVHSAEEAAAAGACDYLVFGTVFATASKPDVAPAGLDALATVARATALPVLAIGGVTPANAAQVAAAGAAGIAGIGLFADVPHHQLQTTVAQTSLAFDTARQANQRSVFTNPQPRCTNEPGG